MCNRYRPPDQGTIEETWRANLRQVFHQPWPGAVYPRSPGPFVRRAVDDPGYSRELVMGRWGLIPWFSKTSEVKYATNNARSEELAEKASYRQPWARSQRCLIPAADFDEPCWETGKNVWWRFRRADGRPLGLAGLWSTWEDKATGELHESYTMLTINADRHPLMSRMHKPDPKLPPDRQDKRSVIPIEPEHWDEWLTCTPARAVDLLRVPADDLLFGEPVV